MANPNHIGCHTMGESEPSFRGTQALEQELLEMCAVGLLQAEPGSTDGYVASGGTESNIQALWTFRNFYRNKAGTSVAVGLLCSEDSHYSFDKAANLLDLNIRKIPISNETPSRRAMSAAAVHNTTGQLLDDGIRHVTAALNMGTTMFGSVDHPEELIEPFLAACRERNLRVAAPVGEASEQEADVWLHIHVDAAFGGFIYPLAPCHNPLTFADPRITSFTLDGHKMLQAPYGTGIHLIRKGYIDYTCSASATYVPGLDTTLCGSRSGANAVAVWMILVAHGYAGGREFVGALLDRTTRFTEKLEDLGVRYFREVGMNVVAIAREQPFGDFPSELAHAYMLVPDIHDGTPDWWKIVVMDHVDEPALADFIAALAKHIQ